MPAANRMRGEAALGSDHTLVVTFNTWCILEEHTGLKTMDLLQMLHAGLGFSDLRSFIWAALQAKHAGVTIEEVGDDIITAVGLENALLALNAAVNGFFAAEEEKKANPLKAV